jgi:hypothetical protein
MLKFYIVKRDEREGDGYHKIMEFESFSQFMRFAEFHRAYIKEIKTLDVDTTYAWHLASGEIVRG